MSNTDGLVGFEALNDSLFLRKSLEVRAVASATCVLSVLGSLFIIITYACFKSARFSRARAREILLHISVADLGAAMSNLLGTAVYFDRFYSEDAETGELVSASKVIEGLCQTQAFFSLYFTYSSVMWTSSLSVYLYLLLVHNATNRALYSLRISYVFCYAAPLFLCLWLTCTGRVGYAPYDTAGWCAVKFVDPRSPHRRDIFATVFGFDLWVYLAIIVIALMYFVTYRYIREQTDVHRDLVPMDKFWKALQGLDYRFMAFPVVFVILRMWSSILHVLYIYVGVGVNDQTEGSASRVAQEILVGLSGVGDSGQGFANAIFFTLFSHDVRNRCYRLCCCCCHRWYRYRNGTTSDNPDECSLITANVGSTGGPSRLQDNDGGGGRGHLLSESQERTPIDESLLSSYLLGPSTSATQINH